MSGIIIFGSGQAGMALYRLLQRQGSRVIAFGDNNEALWGTEKEGLPIWPLPKVVQAEPEEIYLAVVNESAQKEIREALMAAGYAGRLICLSELRSRYQIRLATCRRIAEEIRAGKLPGAIAELGVYQGEFAEELNRMFPERTIYLFDTFTGFDARDIGAADGKKAKAGDFSDTSEQAVLGRMPYPERVRIKKGYFPESLSLLSEEEEQECYALVSLDTDLYQPTLAGLNYFYPRLVPGGYMILDDYHSPQFPGVGEAVREFCEREGVSVVPLCDLHGTAILAKFGKRKSL